MIQFLLSVLPLEVNRRQQQHRRCRLSELNVSFLCRCLSFSAVVLWAQGRYCLLHFSESLCSASAVAQYSASDSSGQQRQSHFLRSCRCRRMVLVCVCVTSQSHTHKHKHTPPLPPLKPILSSSAMKDIACAALLAWPCLPLPQCRQMANERANEQES